jgi:hypothetical protein
VELCLCVVGAVEIVLNLSLLDLNVIGDFLLCGRCEVISEIFFNCSNGRFAADGSE